MQVKIGSMINKIQRVIIMTSKTGVLHKPLASTKILDYLTQCWKKIILTMITKWIGND